MSKRTRWFVVGFVFVVLASLARWKPWLPHLEVLHKGGKGPPTLMLLHGYASSATQWMPYAFTVPARPEGRFLFPLAPYAISRSDGRTDGHAWWNVDLAGHRRTSGPGVDLRDEYPAGLSNAARLVERALMSEGNTAGHSFVLGGFSQGAMVACEVAFNSDEPLAGLVILSGTPIDRASWFAGMARRKSMPVFMSHGRADDVLPFDLAELLRQQMISAGLSVTFVPFDGGHDIPAQVVEALGHFLAQTAR